MGWFCPFRQSTGDFLTAVTNKRERRARPGYERHLPQTPDQFKDYWHSSPEYASLQREMQNFEVDYLDNHRSLADFRETRKQMKSKYMPQVNLL